MIFLFQFIVAIGLDRAPFHMVGTSLGGAIAGCYAADYPQHINKLTLICPACEYYLILTDLHTVNSPIRAHPLI